MRICILIGGLILFRFLHLHNGTRRTLLKSDIFVILAITLGLRLGFVEYLSIFDVRLLDWALQLLQNAVVEQIVNRLIGLESVLVVRGLRNLKDYVRRVGVFALLLLLNQMLLCQQWRLLGRGCARLLLL